MGFQNFRPMQNIGTHSRQVKMRGVVLSRNKNYVMKRNYFLVKLGVGLLILAIGWNLLSFWGPSGLIDLLHFGKRGLPDAEIDKLINPVAPKGYSYPNPPNEAVKRKIDCQNLYYMSEFGRVDTLCLNLFRTSPEEISQELENNSYDRIVLYGQYSVFDAPRSADAGASYIQDLYQSIKFMDQIAIPKMAAAYGLSDLSYIKVTKPYSYLYYRISNQKEIDMVCQTGDDKAGGCARNYYAAIVPLSVIGNQFSSALPVVRPTDKARFSYLTHYPADCYANGVFLHETSHLFNAAGRALSGKQVMEGWLNEQIAGYMRIYGAELICGQGTVVIVKKPEVDDVPKALAEFNSTFAAAGLSHTYPDDNICRQAMLTEWYRYLSRGDYRNNFKRFFVEQRAEVPTLVDDASLAKYLLRLNPDPTTEEFLLSKGCRW